MQVNTKEKTAKPKGKTSFNIPLYSEIDKGMLMPPLPKHVKIEGDNVVLENGQNEVTENKENLAPFSKRKFRTCQLE